MNITKCNPDSENIFESPKGDKYDKLKIGINNDPRFVDVPNEPNQITYSTVNGEVKTFVCQYFYRDKGRGERNGFWFLKQGAATWVFINYSNLGKCKARISSHVNLKLAGFPQVESKTYGSPPFFENIGMFIEDLNVQPYTITQLLDEIAIRMEVI